MSEYPQVRLWQDALSTHSEDDEVTLKARERLRHAYEKFRERARILANEIRRDLPNLTVHDITHSDALWEMAEIIAGPGISLTPTEAFVLGGAFLIHDLGLGIAAYPEGIKSLKDQLFWKDTYAALMIQKQGYFIDPEKDNPIDEEIEKLTTEYTLRELHAKHAEKLALISWNDPETGQRYYLINDDGLRLTYGESIGKVAHSHWLAVSDLKEEFGFEPLGAPSWAPNHWKVDLLKLACLLRVADASHIDARRAPDFLRVLQKPETPSKEHWIFQGRLLQPQLDGDYLTFTSGLSFAIEEAESWWLCLDTLRKLDRELRLVDALITNSEPKFNRFAAHGVNAVEDPLQLERCIHTKGWIPVDTQLKVTDIPSLVRNLGGDELYGHRPMVPLRELIQNAIDAIKARRIKRKLDSNWGEICVRLGQDSNGYWLEVEDNGIGMSTDLLTGSLLDFGKSYWGSALMRKELPGLLSAGFKSIGKYGIGFFSVFMLGEHVRVISRRFNASEEDTKVLEFIEGLTSRPILRDAKEEETLFEAGTRVRVWLKQSPYEESGLLYLSGKLVITLAELCAYISPASDVNINVETANEGHRRVISASDWLEIDGRELLRRTVLARKEIIDESSIEALSPNLRILTNSSGQKVGRACISPWSVIFVMKSISELTATVTDGGLYASHLTNIAGLFKGVGVRAARDQAIPLVEADVLAKWASDQAELAKKITDIPEELMAFASVVSACGGSTNDLPVALGQQGWMNITETSEWKEIPDELLVMDMTTWKFGKENYERLLLNNQVLITYIAPPIILQGPISRYYSERWPQELFPRKFEKEIIKALAQAWSSNFEDLLQVWLDHENRYVLREIGTNYEIPIKERVRVVKKPLHKE